MSLDDALDRRELASFLLGTRMPRPSPSLPFSTGLRENVRVVQEGSSWESIIDGTVFSPTWMTLLRSTGLYAQALATNRPTRTTVEVNRLPTPIAIEPKVMATREPRIAISYGK